MKIYTRTGDTGETSLFGGQRVAKDALRVETYGSVDEVNAHLGVVCAETRDTELREILSTIQAHLFVLGADLATPAPAPSLQTATISPEDVHYLESRIDAADAQLPRLVRFILPGGSPEAARLHVARTVCRRAERQCVKLSHVESINPSVLIYLNRLSDLLFVLARLANLRAGTEETIWPSRDPARE